MPIAPITGMLRKRFWLDISTGLGLGLSAGRSILVRSFYPLPLTSTLSIHSTGTAMSSKLVRYMCRASPSSYSDPILSRGPPGGVLPQT
ncbi:hypothetical protein C8R46DRAFT_592093 [Mycena filopes]|nr:hypothetical protein C8R46DRAFT_592093 [Mycena filopes]